MRNWLLPGLFVCLAALSLVTLMSIAPSFALRQAAFILFSFFIYWFVTRLRPRVITQYAKLAYFVMVVLLAIVLVMSRTTRGINAWFDLFFGLRLQPSQFAVPLTVLFLGTKFGGKTFDLRMLLTFLLYAAVPAALILVAPDFGTAFVLLLVVGSLLLLESVPWKFLGGLAAAGAVCLAVAWQFLLVPYQKQRVTSFFNAQSQPESASYNARQSMIAVGSGGLFGRGVGQGVQSHLRFLPERQTDFVFASFAEEWGFVGSVLVLVLYATIVTQLLLLASTATLATGKLLAASLASFFLIQVGINIGMNVGLLPITGITLPLISYGGSSFLSVLLHAALVQVFTSTRAPARRFA